MPEVAKQTVAAVKARKVSAENISISRSVDHKTACTDDGDGQRSTGATSTIEKQTKRFRRRENEKDLMVKERGQVGAHESEMTDASRSSTLIPGESQAKKRDKGPENRSTRAREGERLSKPDDSLRSASRKSTDVIEWEAKEMRHAKRSERMRPTRRIETLYLRDPPTPQAGARFLFWHHGHYCKSAC